MFFGALNSHLQMVQGQQQVASPLAVHIWCMRAETAAGPHQPGAAEAALSFPGTRVIENLEPAGKSGRGALLSSSWTTSLP